MSNLRYRLGRPTDVPTALAFFEPERHCFGKHVWNHLPGLATSLLGRGAARSYIVEDQTNGRLRWFGLTAFVQPHMIRSALNEGTTPFREFLFRSALDGRSTFLESADIACANTARSLALTILLCRPDTSDLTQSEAALLFRMAYDSFCFAHAGFGLSAVWQEVGGAEQARTLENMGLVACRKVDSGHGTEQILLGYTPDRATAHPSFAMSLIFNSLPSRFGFSPAQQDLLEAALLDVSDREFADQNGLTQDAVKKRWRAIYDRVSVIDPCLVSPAGSGSDQRRLLLGYVRQHLEELRPSRSTLCTQEPRWPTRPTRTHC
jgi:hypothetical protein